MITFSDIVKKVREEKGSEQLVTSLTDKDLEEIRELYNLLKSSLETANEDEKEDLERQIKNLEKEIDKLLKIRIQKLILYSSFIPFEKIKDKMNSKEIEMFETANKAIEEYRNYVFSYITNTKKEEPKEQKFGKYYEVLVDMNKFKWKDKEYGPFKKGDVIQIEEEVAKILIEANKIREI